MKVSLVDLAAQHAEVAAEIRVGWDEVLAKTAFIGGAAVTEFEDAYADAIGVAHCVGVANGTDALELALRASGVCAGGEVILPANTFIATAEAVVRIGASPVLVDVDPVHLFGQTAPVEQLIPIAIECGAVIVEDAAQSQGARRMGQSAGSFGTAAGTSFYPGKNLGAAGDAGAVTTNDADIARKVRLLGGHGSIQKYVHEALGFNSRLDTLQAVVLRAKLRRLAHWNDLRRAAAHRYSELLADMPGIVLPTSAVGNDDVWHLYVVRVDQRDQVLSDLHAADIGAGIHYPAPVHLTPAFAHLGLPNGSYPVSELASNRILSLPLYPHISAESQEYVVQELRASVGRLMGSEGTMK